LQSNEDLQGRKGERGPGADDAEHDYDNDRDGEDDEEYDEEYDDDYDEEEEVGQDRNGNERAGPSGWTQQGTFRFTFFTKN
jgi:hypothetical protein